MSVSLVAASLALAAAAGSWPLSGAAVMSLGAGPGFAHPIAHSLEDRSFVTARVGVAVQTGSRFTLGVDATPLFRLRDGDDGGVTFGLGAGLNTRTWLSAGRSWRWGLDAGAGVLRFSRPVPDGALRTNFTLHLGTFLERALGGGSSLVIGYRAHHISNGGRADLNPGINASHPYVEVRIWQTRAAGARR